MKKLLLILALAAAGLQGWAEDLYLVGNAMAIGWNIDNALRATVMKETGTNVYEWTGYIKSGGTFKILRASNGWDYGYRATDYRVTLSSTGSEVWERNNSGDSDNQWQVSEDGVYKITFDQGNMTIKAESATMTVPALTDGYYQIGSADDLVNFADAINKGKLAPNVNAKLTANIDLTGKDFTPISCANAIKFTGEFDGQGHSITNLNLDYGKKFGYAGLIGYATGGAEVKNVIVGGSVKGLKRVAGIIGMASDGGTITLTNVINMVNVDATGNDGQQNAAGLVGCGDGTVIKATNCANMGSVKNSGYTSGTQQCAAFAGWTSEVDGTKTTFINCWNSGTISNIENTAVLYRNTGQATQTNCYHVTNANFTPENGTKVGTSTLASGELCYKLNDNTSGGTNWYQNLIRDIDSNPVPFNTHRPVYLNSTTYSNLLLIDNYYQLGCAEDLKDFSEWVNAGHGNANAKLTNDIDINEEAYTPIGADGDDKKYKGKFNGQGHRIKNLKLTSSEKAVGLFHVCAEALIENLIMDASCSFTSNVLYGGAALVALANNAGSDGTLTIKNCANEAKVNGSANNKAAFVGFNWSSGKTIEVQIENCYNIGNISGGSDNCAFIGWNQGHGFSISDCYNIGTVENYNGDKNTWARSGGTKTVNNCYSKDVTGSDYNFENKLTMITDEQKTSGELCYKLGSVFRQDLGAGGDAYPVLDSSKPNVYKMTVGNAGYASFVPEVNIATLPTGVTAYVGQKNGNSLHLEAVTTLPADNAFIVKATGGDYYYNNTTESITLSEENDLDFYAADHTADGSQYCLSNKASGVGFYKVGVDVTIPARKAYLTITTTGAKEFYGFDDDDATGISLMEDGRSQMEDGAIYNLAGQRINKMQRGINIVNGKKVLK